MKTPDEKASFIECIRQRLLTALTDLFTFLNMYGKKGFGMVFFVSLERNDLDSQEICEKTENAIESLSNRRK